MGREHLHLVLVQQVEKVDRLLRRVLNVRTEIGVILRVLHLMPFVISTSNEPAQELPNAFGDRILCAVKYQNTVYCKGKHSARHDQAVICNVRMQQPALCPLLPAQRDIPYTL